MRESHELRDERHARLLGALPAIAWSASVRTFTFTYVNPAAETILGYPAEEWLVPNFWIDHLHPEDVAVAGFCHNETLAARDHELVYRMVAADGRTVWLRDYVKVHLVDGVPVELFGIMVDITREREAEAESMESRENFRRMVDLSPDCIGVHVDGVYQYANRSFVQLLGGESEADVLGRTMSSFVHPMHHELVRERLDRLGAGQSVPYVRMKYQRIDGALVDVEVAALPLRYGSRDAVQVIARDITDRVRAEQELRTTEARLQLLAAGTHEAIWEWSPERKELWTNDVYQKIFGTAGDSDTFIDEWLSRVHPDDREKARTGSHYALDEEGSSWAHEYRLRHADGSYRFVLDRGHHVRSATGERRVIGALLDVTENRTIARKLEEAKRLSSLGQVAASLAHEFNNVLMGIQPFVEIIERNAPSSPGVSEAVGHITRSIGRGKRASQEILRFANPKEPQLSSIDTHVWLAPLLGELIAALPASIALSSSIDPNVRFVRADREHLDQVITNLVFNARDAMVGNGRIHVDVAPLADRVRISVSDSGPGIPAHMHELIFEPLFTTKRNGTGLGLAIARRLMERQGGTLTVDTCPEGGTVFHAVVEAGEAPMPPVRPGAPSGRCAEVRRVLLVEDDETAGAGLEELLGLEGYETTWVRAGADACEAARTTRPHVAILDVNLPDGSGVDLVPMLRASHHDLPIVMSTGHVELNLTNEEDHILALMKPYEINDLLGAIERVTR